MTLYRIHAPRLESENLSALYRTALAWAAARADRFELGVEPEIYDHAEDLAALVALGESRTSATVPGRRSIRGVLRRGAADRGIDERALLRTLTAKGAPARARTGDVSPVEEVFLFRDDRPLYVSYDYGTVQTVDGSDEDLRALERALSAAGLHGARLVAIRPAPSSGGAD